MRLVLTIQCDNAAFHDQADTDDPEEIAQSTGLEVARILRGVAKDAEDGSSGGTLRDANGNKVGTWGFDGD